MHDSHCLCAPRECWIGCRSDSRRGGQGLEVMAPCIQGRSVSSSAREAHDERFVTGAFAPGWQDFSRHLRSAGQSWNRVSFLLPQAALICAQRRDADSVKLSAQCELWYDTLVRKHARVRAVSGSRLRQTRSLRHVAQVELVPLAVAGLWMVLEL